MESEIGLSTEKMRPDFSDKVVFMDKSVTLRKYCSNGHAASSSFEIATGLNFIKFGKTLSVGSMQVEMEISVRVLIYDDHHGQTKSPCPQG